MQKEKSLIDWKKAVWKVFSLYIRLRDNGRCISCGKAVFYKEGDAGHFHPKTRGLSIYFHEKNVNLQCTSCNRYQHGNLSGYAIGLVEKYGEGIIRELELAKRTTKRFSKIEYETMYDYYRRLSNDLLRGLDGDT